MSALIFILMQRRLLQPLSILVQTFINADFHDLSLAFSRWKNPQNKYIYNLIIEIYIHIVKQTKKREEIEKYYNATCQEIINTTVVNIFKKLYYS